MKRIAFIFLFIFMAGIVFAQTTGDKFEELMSAARRLRDGNNEALALIKYEEALKLSPNDYEALHSASLLYSRVGNRFGEDMLEKKTQFFRKAKDHADRAIKQNPTDSEGYFAMSVAMGRIAQIAGSKERVAASTDIKKNAESALRYNPQHAGAWHVLGRWNAQVANMSFAEKAAANMLYGGLPEGASNQNALRCYQNALKYQPNHLQYLFDLATIYHTVGDIAKCKETLQALLKLKPVTEDDPGIKEEAELMLSEL